MADSNSILSSERKEKEEVIDKALRPTRLKDYAGQDGIREQLDLFITAARNRGEALDHVLLFGPPGLGKTTLANIIANELGVKLRQTSGPVLEKAGDLAAMLTSLEPHDVLFIDEIHRLSPVVEEILYPALEDFKLDIMIGEGPAARSIKIDLPHFTLVGATTRAGSLTKPLQDRFGIRAQLQYRQIKAQPVRLHAAPAVHLESQTDCFDVFATFPKSVIRVNCPNKSQKTPLPC